MKSWPKIALVLAVIWIAAGGIIFLARSSKPTAESITIYVRGHDIAALTGAARQKSIERVEGMLNRITLDERDKLRDEGVINGFFRSLTRDEQSAFLDATLPMGFKQMMESFNKMDPAKRKQFVEHALADMRKREGENPPRNLDDTNVRKIVDQGLRSFYSDSSADVKLDLAPLIEQMQKNLQGPR